MSASESETVAPSDAVSDDELAADDAAADAADGGDSGVSLKDMLLSTEPDESPDDHPDKSDTASHALIGVKKMLRGAGANIKAGTPAVVNFALAGIGLASSRAEAAESEDEQPDESEPSGGATV
ncbi:hypothetical protein [Halosimplex marinum]|uniref:hypothetical protein n=1 Tax=Halosimplex marinum TaxID=3396620 RepID=UPI003F54AF49